MKDINKTKRSLRDIFPESSRDNDLEEISAANHYPITNNFERKKFQLKNWKIKLGASLLSLLIIIGLGYGLSYRFAKVTVQIIPKQGRLLVSNVYQAVREGEAELKFVLASNFQDEDSLPITTTGKEKVEEKAQGQIIIYNNYSDQAQALVATTRFQAPNGLIYRTPIAVNVPGITKNDSGQSVPGQLEITVIADKAGDEYNLGVVDFSIPGFKGTTREGKIYAKSKTPMTGGFVGERGKISELDKAKAELELKKTLTSKIIQKLKSQVPDNYILFEDAVIVNFTESVISSTEANNQAIFKLRADATGLLFNQEELSKYLASQQVPDYQGESLSIINWEELKFTLLNKDNINTKNLEKIDFKLEGNGHLVWNFNEKELRDELRLSNKKDYKEIFDKKFPTIQTATLTFSPPWIRKIPVNESKIKIEVNLD